MKRTVQFSGAAAAATLIMAAAATTEALGGVPAAKAQVAVVPGRESEGKLIEPRRTWAGQVPLGKRGEAPPAGFLADRAAWERLRRPWRGGEPAPCINFRREFVVVAVGRDPNHLGAVLRLHKGDLRVSVTQTIMAFDNPETASYQFAVVGRAGVKTVTGKPLPPPAEQKL